MASSGGYGPARHGPIFQSATGPASTCYNRFIHWRELGVWDHYFGEVSAAYDRDLQSVASFSIKVHQHASNVRRYKKVAPKLPVWHAPSLSAWGVRGRADHQDLRVCRRGRLAGQAQDGRSAAEMLGMIGPGQALLPTRLTTAMRFAGR